MLDPKRTQAIGDLLQVASIGLRGAHHPVEFKNLALALLLLKYISDVARTKDVAPSIGDNAFRFLVPEGADFDALLRASPERGNGDRINRAFREIESANPELRGIFRNVDFSAPGLGNTEQADLLLRKLLDLFTAEAMSFRGNPDVAAEAAATACDFLVQHVVEGAGRWLAESVTPAEISRLVARLLQPRPGESIGDPCCGSGSMLIACSQLAYEQSGERNCALYGQEKNGASWALAKMNLILHGEVQNQLEWGDSLRDPRLLAADGSLRKFDVVVSSPPFSLREWGHKDAQLDIHGRYSRGIPPRSVGDYAFISHMVATLKPNVGRMAVIVSLGVLFRGAAEQVIRKQLIEENLIEAVIALPTKMFAHTSIPVAILVLRKDKHDDNVLFVDARHSYEHGKTRNVLRQADADQIEKACQARGNVARYAQLIPCAKIASNDYNLSVTRYVNDTEEEEDIDAAGLYAERAALQAELAELEEKLAALVGEINNA